MTVEEVAGSWAVRPSSEVIEDADLSWHSGGGTGTRNSCPLGVHGQSFGPVLGTLSPHVVEKGPCVPGARGASLPGGDLGRSFLWTDGGPRACAPSPHFFWHCVGLDSNSRSHREDYLSFPSFHVAELGVRM